MDLFGKIKEIIRDMQAYNQGCNAGEEWQERGGGPVDDEMLHTIHVSRGLETWNRAAFNKGFTDVAGKKADESC